MLRGTITKRKRLLLQRDLPIDVVEEILKRLPAEDILRCKLLSKTYYNVITNPNFTNDHLEVLHSNKSRNINIAVLVNSPGLESYHSLKLIGLDFAGKPIVYQQPDGYLRLSHRKEIIGSCDGLLCLQLNSVTNGQSHVLWNPITREMFKVPKPRHHHHDGSCYKEIMGFGSCGVGDYKLVMIRDYLPSCSLKSVSFSAAVWTMSTNRWEEIGSVLPELLTQEDYEFDPVGGLCIRGKNLYWFAKKIRRRHCTVLVSYDIKETTFKKVKMPADILVRQNLYDIYDQLTISDFLGSLALFIPSPAVSGNDDDESRTLFDVWVMTPDKVCSRNKTWTKKLSIGPVENYVIPTRASIDRNFVMTNSFGPRMQAQFHFYDTSNTVVGTMEYSSSGARYSVTPWCFTGSFVSIQQLLGKQSKRKRKSARQSRSKENKVILAR